MPAEDPKLDSLKTQQMDKMSATTQKQYGDLQQSTTTFSYAQAAKGKSPSAPSALTAGKASSDATEGNGKRASSSETRSNTMESRNDSTKRTASEGRAPQGNDFKVGREEGQVQPSDASNATKDTIEETGQSSAQDDTKVESLSDKPVNAGQSHPVASTPSSPDYGTTSTSTLPKEDDVFSTANGSSDTTSDKQSQTSHNGNQASDKAGAEKTQNETTSWDEENPVPVPTLKEAAPPPVNIWQIRSQNQAKSKASTSATTQPSKPSSTPHGPGIDNAPDKSSELSSESKKQDTRKKSKTGAGPTEDKFSSSPGKDGHKAVDAAERSGPGLVAPPPPPGDAISWPTPDSAVGDGKKKNQERPEKAEKDTNQTSKPHGKEKWVPVPYVPTAVFATPLPPARRGGRGAPRGGRDGDNRGRNTGMTGNGSERPTVAGAANPQTTASGAQDRGRVALTSTSTNPYTSKPKRASSAGPPHIREQRKPGDPMATEKRKGSDTILPKAAATNNTTNPSRRPSAPNMTKDSQPVRPFGDGQRNEPSWSSTISENNVDNDKQLQHQISEANGQPRAGGFERQNEGPVRPSEFAREFHGNIPQRERGEPRADRGRGGFRGRGGGNHSFFSPNVTNGYPSQYQSPTASPSKHHSNHDRLLSQAQGSSFQSTHHQPRHYRNNSRSHSIPHSAQYGRFSNGHHGGPPHLANLQTDLANEYGYLPAHQGAMSAMPFNSFEPPSVFGMVNLQMNYYFSVENLCKDMYLRSHMDSQGFVFLELLAQFNRIKQLTNDMELIRLACYHSQTIEYVNVDGIDRVRAREGWQQWVRKMEERDPSAQNDGPSLPQYPQDHNYASTSENRQVLSPRSGDTGSVTDNIHYQALNGMEPSYGQGRNTVESNDLEAPATKIPLSAAVSEFSPSARSTSSRNFSTPDHQPHGSSVFTDAQVENLRILVRKPVNTAATVPPPFHSSSSRTFSDGSIDGRSINDELSKFAERQTRPAANGDPSQSVEARNVQRSRSPFSVGSPSRQLDNNVSPPVLWIKDRQNSIDPLKSIPNDCVDESYHDFRQDALKQREQSGIGQDHNNMQSLYQFWSHFLVRNFNARMYEEFHRLALEDANQRDSTAGMRSLIRFYDETVLSQKPVSDDNVARDFVDLVKVESSKNDRPVFTKLRAVWRNGAFNMRNRSKLTKFVDTDLKAELER